MLSSKVIQSPSIRIMVKLSFVVITAALLVSCDLAANYTKTDRAANLDFQDFRDGLAERLPEPERKEGEVAMASIPELQPYVNATPESMKSIPLVSVSVNQTIPLRDILYELAKQAEYDIELDPNIRGSIIFTAKDKPFDLVIDRIANMAGLRYKFEEGFLRVELDTPYLKTYKIDYLSFIRTNSGGVSTSVSVVSGEGADTGSNYTSANESSSDFWAELELNMEQLLGGSSTGALKTTRDPRITAAEVNPEIATSGDEGLSPEGEAAGGAEQPEVVLNVESLPVDGDDEVSGGASTGSESEADGTYSLNKQAGLINVFATEKAHKAIAEYLNELRRAVTAQVLVEAKVFEVTLNDEYINGIQWQAISDNTKGIVRFLNASAGAIGNIVPPGGDVAVINNFGIGYLGGDVSGFIDLISGFGTVRALASPRLTVINNQSAVLNVATNRVFFDIDIDQETDDDTGDVSLEIDSEIRSVPEGVLINVQPSINLKERTVSMFLRPTVTNIVSEKSDPAVLFVSGDSGIESFIPEVNVQEIDTVVRVNSGQPIVMGGLLQDRVVDTQEGVPVVGEVPVLGALFKKQEDLVRKTELVIFLKATILESPTQTIHNTDRDLYKAFSGDRRPFKL